MMKRLNHGSGVIIRMAEPIALVSAKQNCIIRGGAVMAEPTKGEMQLAKKYVHILWWQTTPYQELRAPKISRRLCNINRQICQQLYYYFGQLQHVTVGDLSSLHAYNGSINEGCAFGVQCVQAKLRKHGKCL